MFNQAVQQTNNLINNQQPQEQFAHLTPKIVYNQIIYPPTHFIYKSKDNCTYVCTLKYNDSEYLVEINPTDCRGYRTLISLNDFIPEKKQTLVNRPYSAQEKQGLLTASNIVICAFEQFGLIPQLEIAGNNSQYSQNGSSFCGKETEPSMLHSHVICRGDPDHPYISNIKLGGPVLGELFNMRSGKAKWENDAQIKEIAKALRESITEVMHTESIFKNITLS